MVEKQTKEPCKSDCGCRQSLCGRPAKNSAAGFFWGGRFGLKLKMLQLNTQTHDIHKSMNSPVSCCHPKNACWIFAPAKITRLKKKKNMIRVAFWPSFSRKLARLGSLSKIFGGFFLGIWQSKNENLPNSKIHQNQNCTMYINNAGWHLSCSWKSHLSERARTFPSFFWEGLKLVLPLKWDKTVGSYPIDRDEQWAC